MKVGSPSDRREVLVKIKKIQLNEELEVSLQENGKSTRLQYSMTYLSFVLLSTNFIYIISSYLRMKKSKQRHVS